MSAFILSYDLEVQYKMECFWCKAVATATHPLAQGNILPLPALPHGWTRLPWGALICTKHDVEFVIKDKAVS